MQYIWQFNGSTKNGLTMNIFKKLFEPKKKWLDLGFARLCIISTSNSEDVIALKGIQKNMEGAMNARLAEEGYITSKKCSCGGEWIRIKSSSAYPKAYQHCCCKKCGSQKKFVFCFHEK